MHCRKDWQEAMSKTVSNSNKTKTQAMLCESSNNWAWAAILWRRIGAEKEAVKCETIAQAVAENTNIKLLKTKPIILSR